MQAARDEKSCGEGQTRIEGHDSGSMHRHADGTVTVANTHLDVAKGPGRLNQAIALGKALAELTGPVIWAGDFNAVRNDEVMNAVT